MKKQLVLIVICVGLTFLSCQDNRNRETKKNVKSEEFIDIPFTVVKNYFVKNLTDGLSNPKIDTETKFNKFFGMATTMGKNGRPTMIDFSKQYVVAILKPETYFKSTIELKNVQKNQSGEIVVTYRCEIGQKQTYSILPNLVIALNKSEDGHVVLKELK